MELSALLELNRLAQAAGRRHKVRRSLYQVVCKEKGRHFIGVVGPRGAGKTILLQQLAAGQQSSCYVSLDTLSRTTDLFELLKILRERYQFTHFYLDEVHFLEHGIGALKKIYDFLDVGVTFTSSVALQIHESAHDLARRVRLHSLDYFSFREYLEFAHSETHALLPLESLLRGTVDGAYLQTGDRFEAYLRGGLMPFALDEPQPMPLLEATIETVITRDIPNTLRLHLDELETLRRLLAFVGRSAVDGINYSSLASNLGITKYKAEQYVSAFERAYLLLRLFPKGTNLLREPKVLLMPPLRALYRPFGEALGGLREDFVALAMRQAGYSLHYLKGTRGQKTPDFVLEHEGEQIVFEVGGKGKGRSQFKGMQADRKIVLAQDTAFLPERMPLHLIGFLA